MSYSNEIAVIIMLLSVVALMVAFIVDMNTKKKSPKKHKTT